MTNYNIAKRANSIARQIVEQTKWLKNDTRFGHDLDAKWEAQQIAEMCAELQNLVLPIRLPK